MDFVERKTVTKDQINHFFSAYYSEWRAIQILAIKEKFNTRYEFYKDIIEEIKSTDLNAGENTISQEIKNGLLFEAIATSIQYIEDLFALIKASEKKDFFIKNIIKYDAGKVEHLIKSYNTNKKNICKSFHFPYYPDEEFETENERETLKVINDSTDRLRSIILEIIEYYKKHQFFYNQYKHGLSIALRPYGKFTSEQIAKDKKREHENTSVVALDSLNFTNASRNQYGNSGYLMMPCFTENVQKNIKELQSENNLLRYVMTPPETTIDFIMEIAKKTRRCIHIVIHNFLEVINEKEPLKLRLPAINDSEVYEFKIEGEINNTP
jgi:hypothetical protein